MKELSINKGEKEFQANMRSLSLIGEGVFFIIRGEEKSIDDHRLGDMGEE